jgi:uncharacterized membrane protein YgcG
MTGAISNGDGAATNARLIFVSCCVITALFGFFRIEDRAIFNIPQAAPTAQAAIVNDEVGGDQQFYSEDEAEGAVPVSKASTLPRNRVRRAIRNRDVVNAVSSGFTPLAPGSPSPTAPADPVLQFAENTLPVSSLPQLLEGPPSLLPIGNQLLSSGGTGNNNSSSSGGTNGTSTGGTAGSSTGGASTGGTNGGGGVVSAVPEPSTWLMMISGFVMIGLQARRRKRKMTFTALPLKR